MCLKPVSQLLCFSVHGNHHGFKQIGDSPEELLILAQVFSVENTFNSVICDRWSSAYRSVFNQRVLQFVTPH